MLRKMGGLHAVGIPMRHDGDPSSLGALVTVCGVALTPIGEAFGFLGVPARLLLAIRVIVLA